MNVSEKPAPLPLG